MPESNLQQLRSIVELSSSDIKIRTSHTDAGYVVALIKPTASPSVKRLIEATDGRSIEMAAKHVLLKLAILADL